MLPRAAARGISMWGAADGDGEDYDEEEHIDLADSAADAAFEDEDGTGTAHASPTHARAALAASDVEDDPAAAAGTSPRASARTLADDVYAYFESVGDAVDRCEGMLQFIGRAARADGKRDYGLKRAITEARVRWVHAHPLDDMLKRLCLCVYLLRQRGVVITLRTLPPKKEHAVHHARCKLPGASPITWEEQKAMFTRLAFPGRTFASWQRVLKAWWDAQGVIADLRDIEMPEPRDSEPYAPLKYTDEEALFCDVFDARAAIFERKQMALVETLEQQPNGGRCACCGEIKPVWMGGELQLVDDQRAACMPTAWRWTKQDGERHNAEVGGMGEVSGKRPA